MRLFQTSRRFNVEIQPQLVLLQKTLLNIEGLGRQLDPDLDLWKTAKPYLERWMGEQVGVPGMIERLKAEAPRFTHIIPQLPRLVHRALSQAAEPTSVNDELLRLLVVEQQRTNRMLSFFVYFAVTFGLGLLAFQIYMRWYQHF